MKAKRIQLILILLAVLLVASACAPAKTTFEGRKNRLEAFLIDRANGYDDVKVPNIYGLDEATKSKLINSLAYDVVADKEQILIEYLDQQWPAWRSADGFLVEHLAGLVSQADKALAPLPEQKINLSAAFVGGVLNQFYQTFDNLISDTAIERAALCVIEDSVRYNWQYRTDNFYLSQLDMTVVDLTAAKFYRLQYDGQMITLTTVTGDWQLYGHRSFDENVRLIDEKSIISLLPAEPTVPIDIAYSGATANFDGSALVAVKSGRSYLATPRLSFTKSVGALTVSWQGEAAAEQMNYRLFVAIAPN